MGPDAIRDANQAMQRAGADETVSVMAVMYSMTGNIIAIAGLHCNGVDLKGYEQEIVNAIDAEFIPDRIASHVDTQRFKVKLDKVPTYNADGLRTTPEDIKQAV